MSIIDIDRILQADSVGKNLEDESIFYHLERLLQGKKEVLDSDARTILTQAEPPKWNEAFDVALDLLNQSKDLRIVVGLIRCLVAKHGLMGCELGFKLLTEILEKYWDTLYPVPEDEDDYIVRVNALSPLNDWSETLVFLVQTTVIASRSNKLNFRAFGVAANKLQPRDSEQVLSTTQLKYVISETSQETKDNLLSLIVNMASHVAKIKKKYDETIGIVPDFSALLGVLNWVKPYLNTAENKSDSIQVSQEKEVENVATTITVVDTTKNTDNKMMKKLSTREDAIEILEEICVFLEQSEPAHPAPLFIRRGQKLLGMNFLEIVKELSPDAYDEVCKLGGVNQDD